MDHLFALDALLGATGGRAEGVSAEGIGSISIDSRELGPEALFVAIRGERFDGHDFVSAALEGGAVAALVSEARAPNLSGPLIVVPDPLAALGDLARAARRRSRAKILGVTGSVGKTTIKEALRVALSAGGGTHASVKSFNNHWGVPLSLARLPAEADFGVFELGMNRAGEIAALVELVRPHLAIVGAIAPAHLEAFGSLEAIARAKAEIFSGIEPGGIALINSDHDQTELLIAEARRAGVGTVLTYGFAPGSDWRASDYETLGEGARAEIAHEGKREVLTIAAPGRHMIANATVAFAAAVLCGVEAGAALGALSVFGAQEGRGRRHLIGPADHPLVLIDESYNANTASMLAALEVFGALDAPGGAKVLVLGDMLELGPESRALHAGLAPAVLASGADRVYLVGEHMGALAEALGKDRVSAHAQRADELAGPLCDALAYGDAVMVKGSNGVRLGGLVEAVRQAFA